MLGYPTLLYAGIPNYLEHSLAHSVSSTHKTYVFMRYNPVHQALELAHVFDPDADAAECERNTRYWLEWILLTDSHRMQHLNTSPSSELIWSDQVHRLGLNYLAHRLGRTTRLTNGELAELRTQLAPLDHLASTHTSTLAALTNEYRDRIIARVRRLKHRNKDEHNASIDASIAWEHDNMTRAEHAAHRRRLWEQGRIPWL